MGGKEESRQKRRCLNLNRINHTARFLEEAARWFKRARSEAQISDGQALLASREMIELYTVQLGQPAKAAPELARLAEKYEGTPEGNWARDELAEVKRGMAEAEEA